MASHDVGIIESLLKLPIGILSEALDHNGPYGPGNHSLTQWQDVALLRPVNDTFGVVVQISGAIAPELGLTPGFDDGGTVQVDEFQKRIVQVVQLFQLASGTWVPLEVDDVHYAPYLIRWVEDMPGKIGLYVAPTWSVDLYYLVTI